jgi:hypothetical protein
LGFRGAERKNAGGTERLPLAYQVAAAGGAHQGGMHGAGGDVGAVAGTVGDAAAVHGEGHFTVEDDVGGFGGVIVVGIVGVGAVLPDVGMDETFRAELCVEGIEVHVQSPGGIIQAERGKG